MLLCLLSDIAQVKNQGQTETAKSASDWTALCRQICGVGQALQGVQAEERSCNLLDFHCQRAHARVSDLVSPAVISTGVSQSVQ